MSSSLLVSLNLIDRSTTTTDATAMCSCSALVRDNLATSISQYHQQHDDDDLVGDEAFTIPLHSQSSLPTKKALERLLPYIDHCKELLQLEGSSSSSSCCRHDEPIDEQLGGIPFQNATMLFDTEVARIKAMRTRSGGGGEAEFTEFDERFCRCVLLEAMDVFTKGEEEQKDNEDAAAAAAAAKLNNNNNNVLASYFAAANYLLMDGALHLLAAYIAKRLVAFLVENSVDKNSDSVKVPEEHQAGTSIDDDVLWMLVVENGVESGAIPTDVAAVLVSYLAKGGPEMVLLVCELSPSFVPAAAQAQTLWAPEHFKYQFSKQLTSRDIATQGGSGGIGPASCVGTTQEHVFHYSLYAWDFSHCDDDDDDDGSTALAIVKARLAIAPESVVRFSNVTTTDTELMKFAEMVRSLGEELKEAAGGEDGTLIKLRLHMQFCTKITTQGVIAALDVLHSSSCGPSVLGVVAVDEVYILGCLGVSHAAVEAAVDGQQVTVWSSENMAA